MFDFEADFQYGLANRQWIVANWTHSFYYCVGYVVLVFGIQRLMRDRTGFQLKKLLIAWNIVLATFSLVGFVRTVPELFTALTKYGLHHSVCVSR